MEAPDRKQGILRHPMPLHRMPRQLMAAGKLTVGALLTAGALRMAGALPTAAENTSSL